MNDTQSNVTPITAKQTAPAAKFTITAIVDGFPVQVECEGNAASLRALVARLREIGAEPPVQTPAQKPAAGDEAPVCEFHGAMKRSQHNGWFCPKKMGDGSYCKSRA